MPRTIPRAPMKPRNFGIEKCSQWVTKIKQFENTISRVGTTHFHFISLKFVFILFVKKNRTGRDFLRLDYIMGFKHVIFR